MRLGVTTVATLILLVTTLASSASASHSPLYVYTPVPNKSWVAGALHNGWLGTNVARDITGSPTAYTDQEDVVFQASVNSGSLSAVVETATTNCGTWGGPDKYVILQLWSNGEYFGRVAYVHLRTLNVSAGSTIYSGTTLGKIQNAQSCCQANGDVCWTGIHVHLETQVGTWTTSGSASTPVLTYSTGVPQRPMALPLRLTTGGVR